MKFCIWKTTGQEYTGDYKNGLMHCKGLYEWSEGEFYRGVSLLILIFLLII